MNPTDRLRRLALLEAAALLGITSTLLTWFVGRGQPCYGPPYVDIIVCLPGLRRGFPLVWVTEVDWLSQCPFPSFICRPIVELTVDWFGVAVDILFWTLLFALLLTLASHIFKPSSRTTLISR